MGILPNVGIVGGSDGPTAFFVGGGTRDIIMIAAAAIAGIALLCVAAGFFLRHILSLFRRKNK